ASEQETLGRSQTANRAHIGEQPEKRSTIANACVEDAGGAVRDLRRVVFAFEIVGYLDRFRQRARHVRPHHFAQQRLVSMKMQVDESGQYEAAGRIDFLPSLAYRSLADRGNAVLVNSDIDKLCLTTNPGVANDEVHAHSARQPFQIRVQVRSKM